MPEMLVTPSRPTQLTLPLTLNLWDQHAAEPAESFRRASGEPIILAMATYYENFQGLEPAGFPTARSVALLFVTRCYGLSGSRLLPNCPYAERFEVQPAMMLSHDTLDFGPDF